MPTLNHPRIPNVSVEVADSDVEQWEASGWVNTAPAPKPTPEPDDVATDETVEPPKRKRKRK